MGGRVVEDPVAEGIEGHPRGALRAGFRDYPRLQDVHLFGRQPRAEPPEVFLEPFADPLPYSFEGLLLWLGESDLWHVFPFDSRLPAMSELTEGGARECAITGPVPLTDNLHFCHPHTAYPGVLVA